MKRIGDILALGLLFISIYILTSLTGFLTNFGYFSGIIGSIITIIVEGYFLVNWILNK